MSQFWSFSIFCSLLLSLVAERVSANDDKGGFQSTKLNFFQQDYSGLANRSFAKGSSGYGVHLTLDKGGTVFRYFFRARFNAAEGNQNFYNGNTLFSSDYRFLQFAPEIGISFFPIPRRNKGINVYLWGTGDVSYNNLEIKTLPAVTAIKAKDQAFGYGYGAGIGLELIITSTGRGGGYYMITSELGFRDGRARLANYENFEISGMTYSLGLGF